MVREARMHNDTPWTRVWRDTDNYAVIACTNDSNLLLLRVVRWNVASIDGPIFLSFDEFVRDGQRVGRFGPSLPL